jgi:hypothetical protein
LHASSELSAPASNPQELQTRLQRHLLAHFGLAPQC